VRPLRRRQREGLVANVDERDLDEVIDLIHDAAKAEAWARQAGLWGRLRTRLDGYPGDNVEWMRLMVKEWEEMREEQAALGLDGKQYAEYLGRAATRE